MTKYRFEGTIHCTVAVVAATEAEARAKIARKAETIAKGGIIYAAAGEEIDCMEEVATTRER